MLFKIQGMHCISCALNIELTLEELQGVESVKVDFPKSELEIEFDPKKISRPEIEAELAKLGYGVVGVS